MMHWWMGGLRLVCVVVLSVMFGSVGLGAESLSSADIEQVETKGSIADLLGLYDEQARQMLPILVPDETGRIKQSLIPDRSCLTT